MMLSATDNITASDLESEKTLKDKHFATQFRPMCINLLDVKEAGSMIQSHI